MRLQSTVEAWGISCEKVGFKPGVKDILYDGVHFVRVSFSVYDPRIYSLYAIFAPSAANLYAFAS